jgi:hypothetical protein
MPTIAGETKKNPGYLRKQSKGRINKNYPKKQLAKLGKSVFQLIFRSDSSTFSLEHGKL